MFVVDEIAVLIREFTFKTVEAKRRQSHALQMGQILPDDLFVINAALFQIREIHGKRRIIVHAEKRHLLAVVAIAQHALRIHVHIAVRRAENNCRRQCANQ